MAASMETCGELDTSDFAEDVKDFFKKNSHFETIKNGKVRCTVTGHELVPKITELTTYIKSKKFIRKKKEQDYNWDKYKEFIVPSTKRGKLHQLLCKLTLRHISNTVENIERHITGKRFQKALKEFERCKATGEKFRPLGGNRFGKPTIRPFRSTEVDDPSELNISNGHYAESDNSEHESADMDDGSGVDDSSDEADGATGQMSAFMVVRDCGDDDFSDLYPEADFGKLTVEDIPPEKVLDEDEWCEDEEDSGDGQGDSKDEQETNETLPQAVRKPKRKQQNGHQKPLRKKDAKNEKRKKPPKSKKAEPTKKKRKSSD